MTDDRTSHLLAFSYFASAAPQAVPQAGAGSAAPQAGFGSAVPQAGAGSAAPHAVPHAGAALGSAAPHAVEAEVEVKPTTFFRFSNMVVSFRVLHSRWFLAQSHNPRRALSKKEGTILLPGNL